MTALALGTVICPGADEIDGRIKVLNTWTAPQIVTSQFLELSIAREIPIYKMKSDWMMSTLYAIGSKGDESAEANSVVSLNWKTGEVIRGDLAA